jgi:hypothetical protein
MVHQVVVEQETPTLVVLEYLDKATLEVQPLYTVVAVAEVLVP